MGNRSRGADSYWSDWPEVQVPLWARFRAEIPTRGTSCSELGKPGSNQAPAPGWTVGWAEAAPSCVTHVFLPGSTPGFSFFGEVTWICWGGRGRLMQQPPPSPGMGGEQRAAPLLAVPPWRVAIIANVKLDCSLKTNSCTAMVRNSSPCSEPRLGWLSRDVTTELPGEQSPVLIFEETTHPPCSGNSCCQHTRGRRCRSDKVL